MKASSVFWKSLGTLRMLATKLRFITLVTAVASGPLHSISEVMLPNIC